MKSLLSASLFVASIGFASSSFAAINITSFHFIGNQQPTVAELCGEVAPATGKSELIKITADAGTSEPGSYHTNSGKDGKFCTVIYTQSGRATAELE